MSIPQIAAGRSPTADRHAEPPADAVGHVERREAFAVGDGPERPLDAVGDRNDVALHLPAEERPDEEELRLVSTVEPDFEMTMKSVRFGVMRSSSAASRSGSTLSST